MGIQYNHAEIEYRTLGLVHKKLGIAAWEREAPSDLLVNYGYDAMNMAALFLGEHGVKHWDEDQLYGFYLMLSRIWEISAHCEEREMEEALGELLQEAERLGSETPVRHNAVIAVLMKVSHRLRHLYHREHVLSKKVVLRFLWSLKRYAPCLCCALWDQLDKEASVFDADKEVFFALKENKTERILLMVGGHYRGTIALSPKADKEEALQTYLKEAETDISRKEIKSVIYHPHRILSIVLAEQKQSR